MTMNYDNDETDDPRSGMFDEWHKLDPESAKEGEYILSAAAHIEQQVWRLYDKSQLEDTKSMDILVATMVSSFMGRSGVDPDGVVDALVNQTDTAQPSSVVITRALPAAMLAAAAFSTAAMRIALGGGDMGGRVRLPNEKADASTRCVTTLIQMAARAMAAVRKRTDDDLCKGVAGIAKAHSQSAEELAAIDTIDSLIARWNDIQGGGHHG